MGTEDIGSVQAHQRASRGPGAYVLAVATSPLASVVQDPPVLMTSLGGQDSIIHSCLCPFKNGAPLLFPHLKRQGLARYNDSGL